MNVGYRLTAGCLAVTVLYVMAENIKMQGIVSQSVAQLLLVDIMRSRLPLLGST